MKDHGYEVRTVYVDPQSALVAFEGTPGVIIDIAGARRHIIIISCITQNSIFEG